MVPVVCFSKCFRLSYCATTVALYAVDGISGSAAVKLLRHVCAVQCSAVHQAATALSVQLLLHVHYSKSACSVRTGYVFFGTLVVSIIEINTATSI